MTALDSCEPQIIRALEKAGWKILDKPYPIFADKRPVLADFSVQRIVDGKVEIIIVVEVKCFTDSKMDLPELYTAIGQYWYYLALMRRDQIDLPLYLAIPNEAYLRFHEKPSFLDTFTFAQVNLLIVDTVQEVIVNEGFS